MAVCHYWGNGFYSTAVKLPQFSCSWNSAARRENTNRLVFIIACWNLCHASQSCWRAAVFHFPRENIRRVCVCVCVCVHACSCVCVCVLCVQMVLTRSGFAVVMYAELGAGLPPSSTTITKGVKGRTAISWVVTLPPIRLISDKGTPRKTTTYKYIF